jgi:hypothetical protein
MSATEAVAFKIWQTMIYKCCSKAIPKSIRVGSVVDDSFKDFSKFYAWFQKQPCHEFPSVYLSHDLLFPENKVYTPNACVLLPKEVHDTLRDADFKWQTVEAMQPTNPGPVPMVQIGEMAKINRTALEVKVRHMALKYRNSLDSRAYNALMNYKVTISS